MLQIVYWAGIFFIALIALFVVYKLGMNLIDHLGLIEPYVG